MAFTTLADRFAQSSQEIYGKFATRQTPDGQPYISILPDTADSRSRIKSDSQSVPVVSTQRDVTRVSRFLKSSDGLLFIAKQTLLQTGNTFVNTKLFNPASVLLNTVPFVHARRHIVTSAIVPNPSGLLQNSTVSDTAGRIKIITTGGPTLPSLSLRSFVSTQLKKAANTIIPFPQNYLASRPEYRTFGYTGGALTPKSSGPVIVDPQPLSSRGLPRLSTTATVKSIVQKKVTTTLTGLATSVIRKLGGRIQVPAALKEPEKIPDFVRAAEQFRDNQLKRTKDRFNSKFFAEKQFYQQNIASSVIETSGINPVINGSAGSVLDPLNIGLDGSADAGTEQGKTDRIGYGGINTKHEGKGVDIIRFVFTDSNDNNVQFRAFISQLKESTKTEFNEQRYVGRTERFVTYGGAKRSVSMNFNIAAFSQKELINAWTKVNFLTGLAFPADVSESGFMVPPLFKITVGGIYDNQPCYIETLDFDFIDENITFDVDREVSQTINVTMTISLLEKRSKFYNSPFYKITEDLPAYYSARLASTVPIRSNNVVDAAVKEAARRGVTRVELSLRDRVRFATSAVVSGNLRAPESVLRIPAPRQIPLPNNTEVQKIKSALRQYERTEADANFVRIAAAAFCQDAGEDKDACINNYLSGGN